MALIYHRFGIVKGDVVLTGQDAFKHATTPQEGGGGATIYDLLPEFKRPQPGRQLTAEEIAAGWDPHKAKPNENYQAEVAEYSRARHIVLHLLVEFFTLVAMDSKTKKYVPVNDITDKRYNAYVGYCEACGTVKERMVKVILRITNTN